MKQVALILLCIRHTYALTQSQIGHQRHSGFKYRRNDHVLNFNRADLNDVFCINNAAKRTSNDWCSYQSLNRNNIFKNGSPGIVSLYNDASTKIEKLGDSGRSVASSSTSSMDENFNEDKKKRKKLKRQANRMKVSLALSSMLSAFFLLIYISGPGQWRYYLAGGICAAVSHAITTPVDVIKTKKQVDDSMQDMGIIQSGFKIVKEDGGITALLAGLGPTTVGYLFEGAVKFGIYEVSKPMVRSFLLWAATISNIAWFQSKPLRFIISGTLAGTAASVMLCPMEALRIRLVAEPEFAATGNWVDCGKKMISNEGLMGMWKSLPSMLYKQVPYTVTKNVAFDLLTTSGYCVMIESGRIICGKTKIIIPLLSAILASLLSCVSSHPGDMLLSVMNAHKGKLTTQDHIKGILKENGVRGFFVGIRERLVHVGIIVTVQLLIYDFVKRLVGIPATGL